MCRHTTLVDGAGAFYDVLVCEACGWRRIREGLPLLTRLGLVLGLIRVRNTEAGERFHRDGVY